MKNRLKLFCVFLFVLSLLPGTAIADVRDYVFTYPYGTPCKGEWELEMWVDSAVKKEGAAQGR